MEIKKYFHISEKNLERKDRNIFIPICLGNRFFFNKHTPSEHIQKYLDWALVHTKEKVLFVVVDRIQDTNFFIRNNRTEKASIAYVLKEGEIIKDQIKEIIDTLPQKDKQRTEIIRWEEYETADPFWGDITRTVYKEFKNNNEFKQKVFNAVKSSIVDRAFSEEEYWRLCDYVLDEFSIVYSGVTYKNVTYAVYPYPDIDVVLELVEAIKEGSVLAKLTVKLPDTKTGVVILR